jgi:hypothetical protein
MFAAGLLSAALVHAGAASAVTFTNVSAPSRLEAVGPKVGEGIWFDLRFEDFSNTGFPDLVWADRGMKNSAFFVNQRDGTFALNPLYARDATENGHGSVVADIDHDGYLEILYDKEPTSVVLRRAADGTFEDVAPNIGLDFRTGLSSTFADFDDDGRPDLFTYLCSSPACAGGDHAGRLYLHNDGSSPDLFRNATTGSGPENAVGGGGGDGSLGDDGDHRWSTLALRASENVQ